VYGRTIPFTNFVSWSARHSRAGRAGIGVGGTGGAVWWTTATGRGGTMPWTRAGTGGADTTGPATSGRAKSGIGVTRSMTANTRVTCRGGADLSAGHAGRSAGAPASAANSSEANVWYMGPSLVRGKGRRRPGAVAGREGPHL
jgi:hypothetical protein